MVWHHGQEEGGGDADPAAIEQLPELGDDEDGRDSECDREVARFKFVEPELECNGKE
jgi:hypothetical protein